MAPLASLAVLLADQVHRMFPLMAENCRSSRMRSLLEMQDQILKAAATNKDRVCFRGRKPRAAIAHVFHQDAVIRQDRIGTQDMS